MEVIVKTDLIQLKQGPDKKDLRPTKVFDPNDKPQWKITENRLTATKLK